MASIASEPLHHLDEDSERCASAWPHTLLDLTIVDTRRHKSFFVVCAPPSHRPPVLKDEVIATFEEHEDSVYCAVWSVADAWVFASLSFDGRVVVNHVPSQEKFSILTS